MSNSLKDLGLSLEDLKAIAKVRDIKGYESMSEDELLSAITPSKKAKKATKRGKKQKTSFSKARIKEIREEFNELRYKFSKLKIKEIRKNLYEIENKKNVSESKMKEIEKNLTELEETLSKTKTYYDYDDSEYREIRNVRDLFDLSIEEDYYEPIIVRSAFDGNYIEYGSKGDKGKNLSIKRYLKMIKPYLRDLINNHKTPGFVRYHSSNKSWLKETSSERKTQLTMAINFISSKDSDETRTMHTKELNCFLEVEDIYNKDICILVNDITLPPDDLLRFTKNLLE